MTLKPELLSRNDATVLEEMRARLGAARKRAAP